MKRFCVIIIASVLMVCVAPVHTFAAGKLSVTQENFHVIGGSSIYGYAYAKIENVGDKPIKVNAGLLEIFDEAGDTLTSDDYLNSYAQYLQPDEYTYAYISEKIENIESPSEADDYMLTITGKSDSSKYSLRLPVSNTYYEPDVQVSSYSTKSYMHATVTNDTDETVFGLIIALVLLDDEDNILYITSESMYDSKGITPGSSIEIRVNPGSTFLNYYEEKGYTPTKVDAIAYVNVTEE